MLRPREVSVLEPSNTGAALAQYLARHRDQLVAEWTAAVRQDRGIVSSDALSHIQLTDHIPQLMDDLGDTLCHAFSEDIKEQAAWTSATHGHMRWQDGYDISELLREMRDLRLALMPHLSGFQEDNANIDPEKIVLALLTVHGFLDDAMRISVEQFIASSERAQSATGPGKTEKNFPKKPAFVPKQRSG